MEETRSFVPLLIVIFLAFIVPFSLSPLRRLRVPVVVGEILAGIVVGDSGLGLVGHDPMLDILSLLGFAYLMFLSGLEVDLTALVARGADGATGWKNRLLSPLASGLLAFALTVAAAFVAAQLLALLGVVEEPLLMAVILSTTSLGLVMPILKERGLMGQRYGQHLLVAAVVADFVTMMLFSVYVILHSRGFTLEVLLVLLLFGAFGTVYRLTRLAHQRFPGANVFNSISHATAQIDVRGAFTIAVAFIALAQGLGVEIILGAFLGGALISLLSDKSTSDLHHRLDVIGYGFFIPIFFIMVGVRFDLASILGSPRALLLLPLLVVFAYAVKLLAALVYRLQYSWRETLAAGTLLSSRLSLMIAVAAIGVELGLLDEATNSAIILLAIVTCIVSPLVFGRIGPRVAASRDKFVIAGAGRLARVLARRIAGHGQPVVVVDRDAARAGVLQGLGIPFVHGDVTDPDTWAGLDPRTIRGVAVMLPDDDLNYRVSRMLCGQMGVEHVVARVHEATRTQSFVDLGVRTVNPSLSPVVELEYLLLYPSVSSLLGELEDDHDVVELEVRCPDLTGQPLRDLRLPQEVLVVLIRRDGDVIYPRGDAVLHIGDRLTLMGSLAAVHEVARRCE